MFVLSNKSPIFAPAFEGYDKKTLLNEKIFLKYLVDCLRCIIFAPLSATRKSGCEIKTVL